MKRSTNSLIGQVVAVNVLLVVATLFAASAAASLNLHIDDDQRRTFALLALTIVLVAAGEHADDPAALHAARAADRAGRGDRPAGARPDSTPPDVGAGSDEVDRLAASFRRLLGRIEAERRRSGRLALRAQEEERKRLARDLHDEVNQALTAILLRLQAVSQDAPPEVADELAEVRRLVNQAMDELLRLARQLRPTALDDHGLYSAIEGQVRRFSTQTGIDDRPAHERRARRARRRPRDRRLPRRPGGARERRAPRRRVARRASSSARSASSGVELTVRDDGRGFATAGAERRAGPERHGRARAPGRRRARDRLPPGAGTAVSLRVPVTCCGS